MAGRILRQFESWFDAIGALVQQARVAIETGDLAQLGTVMDENQAVLEQLGVSSAPLQRLIAAARGAGALGAKLSGGGRGGNVIALVTPSYMLSWWLPRMLAAGAVRTITTTIAQYAVRMRWNAPVHYATQRSSRIHVSASGSASAPLAATA